MHKWSEINGSLNRTHDLSEGIQISKNKKKLLSNGLDDSNETISVHDSDDFFVDSSPKLYIENTKVADISSHSSDDEDSFDIENFATKKKASSTKANAARLSVSAEVFGVFNKQKEYIPVVIPKSDSQKENIRKKLDQAFIFGLLEENEKRIIVDAMQEKIVSKGSRVIKQGDDGDVLYLVEDGMLDCLKDFGRGDTFLLTYSPGMTFGELSLLYNTPRAASVIAKTNSVLWTLDRECFNAIVRESSIKRRERFESFISEIEILSDLDPYERSKLSDVLKPQTINDGDYVIREGEIGESFYFIESGEAVATKGTGEAEQIVYEYRSGQYFGELALLSQTPRAANVRAKVII